MENLNMKSFNEIKKKIEELEVILRNRICLESMNLTTKNIAIDELVQKSKDIKEQLIYMLNQLSVENNNYNKSENEVNENLFLLWKKAVSNQINYIYDREKKYTNVKSVYKDIYTYMRNVYGIVWEQEEKEWREVHVDRPQTLEIIYNNRMYKSIFDSILHDKYAYSESHHPDVLTIDEIIEPLAKKMGLNIRSVPLNKVYIYMETVYKFDWNRYIKRYQKVNGSYKGNRELLYWNRNLMEKFREVVSGMCRA